MAEADNWKEGLAQLCLAAEQFRLLAPWGWMDEDHLFGVKDPWTDQVGWCMVMGRAGIARGLIVYRGEQGYLGFALSVQGILKEEDVPGYMDALVLDFCDRKDVPGLDYKMLKDAGVRPRGKGAWPRFRSCRPWHAPWLLDEWEIRYMRLVLEQVCLIASALRDGTAPPLSRGPRMLVRQPFRRGDGWAWINTWRRPALPPPPPRVALAEDLVRRLRTSCSRSGDVWEVDVFPAPIAVGRHADRPCLPPTLLVVSDGSPPCVALEAVSPGPFMWADLLGAWAKGALEVRKLPRLIRVSRAEVADMLDRSARVLGIAVQLVDRLEGLGVLRRSFEETLAGG